MKNVLIREGVCIGIVLMLSFVCISPTIANISNFRGQYNNQKNQSLQQNWIGTITVIWDNVLKPRIEFDVPDPDNTSLSYPIINNETTVVNVTVICRARCEFFNLGPRFAVFIFGVWDERVPPDGTKILSTGTLIMIRPLEDGNKEEIVHDKSIPIEVYTNETVPLGIWLHAQSLIPFNYATLGYFDEALIV